MSSGRSEARGHQSARLTRAQTLDLCARLASYGEAGATPRDLLLQAGAEAVRSFAEDADVLVAVGRMYLMGEELAEAERVLQRAVRRAPEDAHALRILGEVLLRLGDPGAAHDALSSAVASGMNDPWTKTWVARALDYSELFDDLGRDGIARDVRQVLGKPGQGPPEDERRLAPVRSDPPARRYSRSQVLGKIDKGIFFAGDPRAELPDFRRAGGIGPEEIVDLPTPAAGGVAHRDLGLHEAREPAAGGALAKALADDAAWGGAPSEAMPPSDTEISAWVPEMEAVSPRHRSAPPVVEARRAGPGRAPRSTDPPPPAGRRPERVAPLPPGLPRLSAGELFDEFTDHKRSASALHKAAAELERARDAASAARKGPPPLPAEPPRRTPPPLPAEPAGRMARPGEGLIITVLEGDAEGPVTAPPSALIPLSDRSARDVAPDTAPASALLPPEPPSLQIPSRLLLGGSAAEARAALEATSDAGPHARQSAPGRAPAPPAEKKQRSRVQLWVLRGLAFMALGMVLGGAFEMYKRNRATKIRALAAQASVALHNGGPAGVADAEAALASARSIDPKSRLVASATVRMLFFAVIDVDPARAAALGTAMEHGASVGLRASDMAFAAIARAVATGDPASASEMIANDDDDPDRAGDALYQLAAGVALEPTDPAAAVERYRASAKLNGDVLSTEIRFIRALLYSGQAAEARQRLATVAQKWSGRPEPAALAALVAAVDLRPGEARSLPPGTDVDVLPRPLRPASRCLVKDADEQALAKAIAEAEVAPTLVLCGEIALRGGHDASAREAARRALDIASGYAPAYALVARVALASGRFEEARQAALRAPAETASEILAFIAYEAGDIAAMTAAAGRRANGPATEPVAAGVARLTGAAPLAPAIVSVLARSTEPWADVVAMDAALDAGDLAQAQLIANGWHGAEKHPIRAPRLARLLRYQGKNGQAQVVAASAAPTLAARVEIALAAAEMANARTAAIDALRAARAPEERWAAAFLLAREGRTGPARLVVRDLAIPGAGAPLLLRTVAALALGELKMRLPAHPMFLSLEEWTRNPDVARALGVPIAAAAAPTPAPAPGTEAAAPAPSAPSTAPAPTAPPEKPRLTGKLPKKDDGEDPY